MQEVVYLSHRSIWEKNVKYSVYKFSMQTKNEFLAYDFEQWYFKRNLAISNLYFRPKKNQQEAVVCSQCEKS